MPRVAAPRLMALAHVAALLPLAILIWQFARGELTADPIRELVIRTGDYALVLLVLSLACTPVSKLSGMPQVLRLRRLLGLYAFAYTALHLIVFVALDYGFDLDLIWKDVLAKRFALVGVASFLALLPLAIASVRGRMNQPGRMQQWLHRLTYLAALLAVGHFLLEVKVDRRIPLIYGAIVVLLLLFRLPWVTKGVREWRNSMSRKH
ncbi:MAG: Ferric reductase domain protein transrane component, N-terminal domain [Dehalococcoidia bacterium]|nr:Ferric reductase domain protein transrane component, N-terminal domain [Dehalococcoidia bacterium]